MFVAATLYTLAMVLANLSITYFGLASVAINAFLFIGFDLTMRDVLGARLSRRQMAGLIGFAGALTYLLNPAAGQIAVASSAAFMAAALADWATFNRLRGPWLARSNVSNLVGAAVDSVVFPLLAFSGINPEIALKMLAAKVLGGFVWSLVFSRLKLS